MSDTLPFIDLSKNTETTSESVKDTQKLGDLPKDIEKFGDGLIKAWEQYLKIIDLLIALCGATVVVLVTLMKDLGTIKNHPTISAWTIATFGFTLLFVALWRFASQHFYEYETIGSELVAKRYFSHYGISKPFTRAFVPQTKRRTFYRLIFPYVAHGTGLLLATTWLLMVILSFDISNSPATPQISPDKTVTPISAHLNTLEPHQSAIIKP